MKTHAELLIQTDPHQKPPWLTIYLSANRGVYWRTFRKHRAARVDRITDGTPDGRRPDIVARMWPADITAFACFARDRDGEVMG